MTSMRLVRVPRPVALSAAAVAILIFSLYSGLVAPPGQQPATADAAEAVAPANAATIPGHTTKPGVRCSNGLYIDAAWFRQDSDAAAADKLFSRMRDSRVQDVFVYAN